MHIPESIKKRIDLSKGILDRIGRSEAQVLMYDDMVLKIQPESNSAANEHNMLRWLQGRLPVPDIIEEANEDGMCYLLMSRVQGKHLCTTEILDDQHLLAEVVAYGLKKLWSLDISDCPTDRSLEQKFREIDFGLRSGAITMDNARQEETYGPSGFKSPAELFDWLVKHRPDERLVLSHGDYCLPNIICEGGKLAGYIDLGYAGAADQWVDIEMVQWSMWANTTGQFGGKCRPFNRQLLFDALGMEPDEEKIRYYSLLNELC